LQDTSDLYDGERCSRCFDKYNIANKKGIFSKGTKQEVANQYGCYRNETEWNQRERKYNKYKHRTAPIMRPVKIIYVPHKEYDEEDNVDAYVYDDFCVPDDDYDDLCEPDYMY
jgi:hypothetical protein